MSNAEEKLKVAEKLFKSGDYEDAVSRAYYAVFHVTQALLLTEGERAETHKGVVTLQRVILKIKFNMNPFSKYLDIEMPDKGAERIDLWKV